MKKYKGTLTDTEGKPLIELEMKAASVEVALQVIHGIGLKCLPGRFSSVDAKEVKEEANANND